MSRTVIFDFDGTLADSIAVGIEIYNEIAPKIHSVPLEASEIPELRKLSYKEIIKKKKVNLFRLPWLMRVVPKKMKQRIADIQPYPGITDLLRGLLNDGYQVGVLSSNSEDFLLSYLQAHDFPKLSFVISEKSLFGKDKALKKIMKKYSLSPNQVTYVGDEPRDIEAARKAGISSVGVTWGLGGREGLSRQNPDNYADTTGQLDSILRASS